MSDEELKTIDNPVVFDSFIKAKSVLAKHKKIAVSISGGADSDIVLDLIERVRTDENDVHYVWFNTGIEYQATKDHLDYLEDRYGITIERIRAKKPIPVACKEYGQPFLSKFVSEAIAVLQRIGFRFEDKPIEDLLKEYQGGAWAIRWWCNWRKTPDGLTTMYNINYYKWLKEFLIETPPTFKINNLCCKYSKKRPAREYQEMLSADLDVTGIRKSEGGVRSVNYKNCYTAKDGEVSRYRPIFWYSNADKRYYETRFNIVHSRCYTVYGFSRTGCCGCPYNREIARDLLAIKDFEPMLYKACNNIFRESYEYTRKYREFVQKMDDMQKQVKGQTNIYDFIKEA